MNTRKQIVRKRQAQLKRRNQILIISGIVLLAIVVVVILILKTPRPSNTAAIVVPTKQTWPQAAGNVLGSPDAKVVVSEFADFQCPICADFHTSIWPQLISQYVATGKVRFEYHHFLVIDNNIGGVESRHAAEASECASEQNAFWDYANILFANQQSEGSGTFGDDRLKTLAADISLDTAKFNACFDSHKYAQAVVMDEGKATSYGLKGTPSVLVNGALVNSQSPLDFASIKSAIDAALAK
jgi:protein-disulfide isomerase